MSTAIIKKCPICEHVAKEEAEEIYLDSGKNIKNVEDFFKEKFKKTFPEEILKEHFEKHIEEEKNNFKLERKNKEKELEIKSFDFEKDLSKKFLMVHEILWERMINIFASENSLLKTKEEKNMHMKQSKEICELAKSFKDFYEMRMNIIGMGKTEEEAKADMQSYFAGMIKQFIGSFSDMPEVQERISNFLNTTIGNKKQVIEEDEEEDKG